MKKKKYMSDEDFAELELALEHVLEKAGMEVLGGTPDELRQLLVNDAARWGAVVKAANVRLE